MKAFERIIDRYIQHIEESKNGSMLARIYGIFSITTNYFVKLNVMIMQKTDVLLDSKKSKVIKFDLKGSRIGRYTKINLQHLGMKFDDKDTKKSLSNQMKNLNCCKIMKDVNLLEINKAFIERNAL